MNLVRDHLVSVPMRRVQSLLYQNLDDSLWTNLVTVVWNRVEVGIGLIDHGSTGYTGYSWNNDNWIGKLK